MRKSIKAAVILGGAILGSSALGFTILGVKVLSREAPRPVASTRHSSIGRADCLECHAPIAAEWSESYHRKSVTGPYWREVRDLGYLDFFRALRKPCLSCHAPANVLDLAEATDAVDEVALGVECTPNIFRDPRGVPPPARADDVELGVDCTACHVARRGLLGTGRFPTGEHEAFADRRFADPALASAALCGTCHRSTVEAWRSSKLRFEGRTCLDCHMPLVQAATVAGGPLRTRRSHRFLADKDETTLRSAIHASLAIEPDRTARFRITNDAVGHHLPSGGNWLSVRVRARDAAGRVLAERVKAFGREEALVLDFWPFSGDERIPYGEQRQILLRLPEGHGTVEAVVNYHDWSKTRTTVLTLNEVY